VGPSQEADTFLQNPTIKLSKRRTRKQKEKAKHHFNLSWKPKSEIIEYKDKTEPREAVVKGQTKYHKKTRKTQISKSKYSEYTGNYENLGTIRHNLVKSLLIASLILSLELMLYFKW
jgi:hypothetical protein